MTSLFPPFNRRSSFRKQPYFYEAGRGVNYKSTGGPFPTLDLNFLSGTLDPRITFSRASNATLTDSTGKITYAPNNLFTYSQEFDNAAWVKTDTTVTANATAAPDGTVTADKLVEAATTAFHQTGRNITTAAALHTFSCYAKASERNIVFLYHTQTNAAVSVNLSTGATGQPSGTVAPTASSVVSVGSGWYRISITVNATAASNFFGIYLSNSLTGGGSYAGDGVSGVFLWGAQLEAVTYQTTPSTYNATTTAAYYGPRFDYDPATLAAKGLLIEEARTNLLTYSEQFDNAAWVKSDLNTTGTPSWVNVGVAPDGTQTADKFIENTVTAFHYMDRTLTISASTAYTFSVYLKAGERTFGGAHIFENGAARGCSINLTTGALGTPYGGATASAVSVGNGWYRLSVTITSSTTTALPAIYLSNTNALAAYTGNGTSGIFVWGAQLEAGAFATSYIPTVASSVARSADIATMTGTNFSSWFNQGPVNLLLQSQTFDNASWSKTNTSISADSTTAPDGTTTADTLVENTVNGFHLASQVAGTVGNTETLSAYAKPAGRSWFVLQLGANAVAYFNVTTGALGNVSGGTANITSVGNGWYRCSVTGVRVTNQSNNILLASANGTSSYLGDGTSGVYLWGAQLEVGSTATTYIPTTTAPVANPPAVGTFVGSYSVIANTTTNQVLLRTDGSTGISIRAVDGGGAGSRFLNSDTTLDISIATYPAANTTVKLGAAFSINDAAFSKNGSSPSTDMSYTNISAVTFMNIGCFSNSAWFINGCVQSIKYYNQRLPNAKLQALTV